MIQKLLKVASAFNFLVATALILAGGYAYVQGDLMWTMIYLVLALANIAIGAL